MGKVTSIYPVPKGYEGAIDGERSQGVRSCPDCSDCLDVHFLNNNQGVLIVGPESHMTMTVEDLQGLQALKL